MNDPIANEFVEANLEAALVAAQKISFHLQTSVFVIAWRAPLTLENVSNATRLTDGAALSRTMVTSPSSGIVQVLTGLNGDDLVNDCPGSGVLYRVHLDHITVVAINTPA